MFKKLLFTMVLCLLLIPSLVLGFQCKILSGAQVLIATPNGPMEAMASADVGADPEAEQPSAEVLQKLGERVGADWSDGVSVIDEHNYKVMVHSSDLNCE